MSVTEINSARKTQKALYRNIKNINPVKIENGDKIIGMTMLTDDQRNKLFAVKALYLNEEENPYEIRIISDQDKNKELQDVDVRKVNPKAATMIEIFALCCYCDSKKISDGSAFGSFRELKNYTNTILTFDDFRNKKVDWERQVDAVKGNFLDAGLFYQYQSCLQLLDIFDYAKLLALDEKEIDTTKTDITISEWKKEVVAGTDVRDVVSRLMKKELFK